jgi:HK97 family phage major capsid protein/HK97 family phage prohead protease
MMEKMTTKSSREIRVLPINLKTRKAGDNGKRTITGAILYNQESQVMRDFWGDQFVEELAAGCFDESLQARDVIGLWSHDIGQVLGSTKSDTLRLNSNEERLAFELDLPDTQAGNDSWVSIQRGDVNGVSFGMVVLEDKWSKADVDGQDVYKRTILGAELYEVSPTVFAAYPANEITCRSLEKYKKESDKNMNKDEKTKEKKSLEETIKEVEESIEAVETRTTGVPAVAITKSDNRMEQRAAFNHYLRTGEIRQDDPVLMTVGNTGAIVPDDFSREIIDGLNDEVVMRKLARILPAVSGKSAVYPRRTGGSGAAMVAEGEAIVPHDLTFDQVVLTPKKAAALVEVSNELLADAGVDIAGYLRQHFVDEIGELLEGQYWLGDADGANLQGILTADDGDTPTPALLIERIPTAGAAVDVDDVLGLWAALPAKYRKNATFVCNSAMEAQLRKLKDEIGQYLMIQNLTAGMGSTLLGRPLVIAEEFPGTLEAGTDALMVGDFSRAIFISDKKGIDIQRNDAAGFYSDVTAFRAIFRTDVALALPEALKVLAIKAI